MPPLTRPHLDKKKPQKNDPDITVDRSPDKKDPEKKLSYHDKNPSENIQTRTSVKRKAEDENEYLTRMKEIKMERTASKKETRTGRQESEAAKSLIEFFDKKSNNVTYSLPRKGAGGPRPHYADHPDSGGGEELAEHGGTAGDVPVGVSAPDVRAKAGRPVQLRGGRSKPFNTSVRGAVTGQRAAGSTEMTYHSPACMQPREPGGQMGNYF